MRTAETFSNRAIQMEETGHSDFTGVTAHLQHAALLRVRNQLREAEASIRYALQKISNSNKLYGLCVDDLVSTLIAAKQYDEAAKALLKKNKPALFNDVNPDQIRLASIRLQQGQNEECIRITEEQEKLAIDGRLDYGRVAADLEYMRGLALKASHRNARARAELQKSVNNYVQSCGLEAIVPSRFLASDAPALPVSPAQGHLYDYKLVSDWDESANWKYASELENAAVSGITRRMLQPPPDVVPLFIVGFEFPASIKSLDLSGARKSVVTAWLSAPGASSTLETINLSGAELDKSNAMQLTKFSQLKRLNLADAELPDEFIASLSQIKKLDSIDLSGQSLNSQTVSALARLPMLQNLNLAYCTLPFAEIAKLANLQKLSIVGSNARDVDVPNLCRLPQLQNLDISSTNIGDSSVSSLGNIRTLKRISISSAKFSEVGRKRLVDLGCRYRLTVEQ